jgi:hypothetical protein
MKVVDLAKVAAGAEALRFKRQLLRYGRQVAFLVVAGVFGFFALIAAHVVLWTICYGPWNFGRVWASVTVLGVDVVVAVVLVLLGKGKLPDPIEIEARISRDRSLSELRTAVAMTAVTSAMTGPVGRLAGRSAWGLVKKVLPGRRRRL